MKRKLIYGLGITVALIGIVAIVSLFVFGPRTKTSDPVIGKWMRPDGGYVLEIRGMNTDGTLEVAYFNPSPIHVARAKIFRQGGAVRVFFELQDVNYPGSNYILNYDPGRDQLEGEYYQAVARERYKISFVRIK